MITLADIKRVFFQLVTVFGLKNTGSGISVTTPGNAGTFVINIGTSTAGFSFTYPGGVASTVTSLNTAFQLQAQGTGVLQLNASFQIFTTSAGVFAWTSGTLGNAVDTALGRNATLTCVEVNNGTLGTFSPLVASKLFVNSTSTNNSISTASQGAATTTLFIGNSSINVTSDVRIKKNVIPSERNAVALCRQMRVVDFDWNDPADRNPLGKAIRGRYTGMLAQEMIDVAPWIVNAEGRDCPKCRAGQECEEHPGPWHVEYEHLVPLLVKAVQELSDQVRAIKKTA